MERSQIETLVQSQRSYFLTGATLHLDAREAALRKLKKAVERHECDLSAALLADLGKCGTESYMCELNEVTACTYAAMLWDIRVNATIHELLE